MLVQICLSPDVIVVVVVLTFNLHIVFHQNQIEKCVKPNEEVKFKLTQLLEKSYKFLWAIVLCILILIRCNFFSPKMVR